MLKTKSTKISGDPSILRSLFAKSAIVIPFFSILPALYLQNKTAWTVGVVVGCFSCFFCIFLVLLLRNSVCRFEQALAEIEDEEYLQKWEYSTAEWQNFSQQELHRRKKRSASITKYTIVISTICYTIILFFFAKEKNFAVISLLTGTAIMFFAVLAILIGRNNEKNWRKNNINIIDKDTLTAFISKTFVIFGKEYHCFEEPGLSLLKTNVENNNLVFIIEIQAKQKLQRKLTILIPQQQENRAKQIANTLNNLSH